MLQLDAKNYHAWQHRQWAFEAFDLFASAEDSGLAYCVELLEEDLRNNSAWNHRHFIIAKTTTFSADVIAREIQFAFGYIRRAVHNESAWNYLRGVLAKSWAPDQMAVVCTFCRELRDAGSKSPFVASCLVDVYEHEAVGGNLSRSVAAKEVNGVAVFHCRSLSCASRV